MNDFKGFNMQRGFMLPVVRKEKEYKGMMTGSSGVPVLAWGTQRRQTMENISLIKHSGVDYLARYEQGKPVEVIGRVVRKGAEIRIKPDERADPSKGEKEFYFVFENDCSGFRGPPIYYVYKEVSPAEGTKIIEDYNAQREFDPHKK